MFVQVLHAQLDGATSLPSIYMRKKEVQTDTLKYVPLLPLPMLVHRQNKFTLYFPKYLCLLSSLISHGHDQPTTLWTTFSTRPSSSHQPEQHSNWWVTWCHCCSQPVKHYSCVRSIIDRHSCMWCNRQCCDSVNHAFILSPNVIRPVQPSEIDTLSVPVAADETLLDGEGEGDIDVDPVESEGRDGEHQVGTRDETEQSCQEECSVEHNDGHDPKELSSSRHRIPRSQRCAASAGIWPLHVLLASFHLLNVMLW